MKHAGPDAFAMLEPLLRDLRALPGLSERSLGVFYRRSKAFLHFHEDDGGLFADFRFADRGDFERVRVSTAAERKRFLALVRNGLQ
jgi:hypothetical protein